jgi:PEP-CTERM motif
MNLTIQEFSMMKRSLFCFLAVAMISLAGAPVSHAGTILATFTVTGGTADDIELFYTTPVISASIGSSSGVGTPTLAGIGTDTLTINFGTASAAGNVLLTVDDTPGHLSSFTLSDLSANVTASALTVQTVSTPEPTSIALLGVGVTGFLAFRRLFKKRSSVA